MTAVKRELVYKETFKCFIRDDVLDDGFSATVIVEKHCPIRQTKQRDGKVELLNIYMEPLTDNVHSAHHHFVVTLLDGKGLYIVRDRDGVELHRRYCSVWDLGNTFGKNIARIMRTSV